MPRGYKKFEIDREGVRCCLEEAKDLEEFKRFQCIHLRVNAGLTVSQISDMVGLAESTIHNIHTLCRQKGIDALRTKGRGGRRRSYLSIQEEKDLLEEILPEASKGGILEVALVHKAFENRVGHSVARYSVYRLLHRHNWRKISPRPRHPKADSEAQEAFKKSGQRSLSKDKRKRKKQESL
jgi:transposase